MSDQSGVDVTKREKVGSNSTRKEQATPRGGDTTNVIDNQENNSDNGLFENEEWVTLEMKLIDWSYMDFSRTVRVDNTSLHTIKEAIKQRHGGNIAKLTLAKDRFVETNELRQDHLTLKECGIDGVSAKSEAPIVTLYYDFKVDGGTDLDPILMC